ncbi:MAG TPA: hypothetical protein VNH22_03885, partial [Blastocatellia bacterium]|nr:hypothetical protein [Blastocatellia bacterium]
MKRFSTFCLIVALAAFLIAGCGRYDKNKNEAGGGDTSAGKTSYASKGDEGTISGVVKFDGTPPTPKRIDMGADANCSASGGSTMTDDVVVTDGKLENVFVYVKGGPVDNFSFETPSTPVTIDQQGCRYHPRVLGIQTGQTLKVTNSDSTTHNVHPTPKNNQEWNQSQSPNQGPIEKKFNRPETLIP